MPLIDLRRCDSQIRNTDGNTDRMMQTGQWSSGLRFLFGENRESEKYDKGKFFKHG